MPDQINDPDNQGPRSDFEVFRVPSQEMLEKYSESPKDLSSPNPTGGTDQKEASAFGFTKPAPVPQEAPTPLPPVKNIPEPAVKPASQTVPPKVIPQSEPKKPQQIMPQTEPEDMFSQNLKTQPPTIGKPPLSLANPPMQQSENTVVSKSRKWIWILIIVTIILIPVILLALEWFGVYSFGFSKFLGSPPSKLAWSRTKFDFNSFSASFAGTIDLKNAELNTSMAKWAKDNHYDQKDTINFSGNFIKSSNVISGTWAWANDPTIHFRIEDKKLYLQRVEGNWYSLDIGANNIDTYFSAIQTFFSNANNFNAKKPDANDVFTYQAKISNAILGISNYDLAEPTMVVDLNKHKFNLQTISITDVPSSGINLNLTLNSFNNESIELSSLDKKAAKPGNTEFSGFYSLFNLIVNKNATQEASNVNVDQTTEEKNDIKRKADLAAIALMLNNYKTDHSTYPVAATTIKVESNQDFIDKLTPYLAVGTTWNYADPLWPNKFYGYKSADGTTYSLTAVLQNTSDPQAVSTNGLYLYTVTPASSTNTQS